MRAPLWETWLAGEGRQLLAALLIGVAFGWCLERAGLASARRLVGQFHGRNMAVLEVMLSAIVTAMLGVLLLGRAGLLDPSRLYVPETWIVPQLAGGLLFGAGLVVAGLCPGTACASAASGRGDGLAVMGGVLAGVTAGGATLPRLAGSFYGSTARGVLTLPEVLHLSPAATSAAVVALALATFSVVARMERVREGA
ncbi:MAG: DUF6691 family protein [Gemmatimonadaceae bacterium]